MNPKIKHLITGTLASIFLIGSSQGADILFVDDETPDASWNTLITGGGHTFTLFDKATYNFSLNNQESVDYVEGFDLIIISGSNPVFGDIRTHGATWNTLTTPMINLGNFLISGQFSSASWQWTTPTTGGTQSLSGSIDVLAPADPIWTGVTLTTGTPDTVNLYASNAGHTTLGDDTFLPGITAVAAQSSDNGSISIAYAAPDAVRPGSQEQYFFGSMTGGSGNPVTFTTDGEIAFLNAINILTGGVVVAVPLELNITENTETTGSFDFQWTSNAGRAYDLVSSTDLSTTPDTWGVWENNANILASETGLNTLTAVAAGNSKRFFAIMEKDPPIPIE